VREYAPPTLINALGARREGGGDGGAGGVWLYAMFSTTRLSVFDVSAASPADYRLLATTPVSAVNATDAFLFGSTVLTHQPTSGLGTTRGGTGAACHYVYTAFSSVSKRVVGVAVHRASLQPSTAASSSSSSSSLVLTDLGFVEAASGASTCASAQASYVQLDESRRLLFAAFSCVGVAMLDLTNPASPLVLSMRYMTNRMVFQLSLGPPPFVFIGLPAKEDHANGLAASGVAIVNASDAGSFANSPEQILPVSLSAIAQAALPPGGAGDEGHAASNTNRSVRLAVAAGAGGVYVHQVAFGPYSMPYSQ
jgi:hypothetical protein